MKKNMEERIERILADYHPEVEPGEESMTFEEAKRLVEGVMAHGHSEDEAIECLKYCTVGEAYKEMRKRTGKDNNELAEQIQEGNFYAKMAVKKTRHIGLMMMTMFNLNNAKKKGNDTALAKGLFTFLTILCLFDDVEVLIHEIKDLINRR